MAGAAAGARDARSQVGRAPRRGADGPFPSTRSRDSIGDYVADGARSDRRHGRPTSSTICARRSGATEAPRHLKSRKFENALAFARLRPAATRTRSGESRASRSRSSLVVIALVRAPATAWAWTPGTHVFLGEAVLARWRCCRRRSPSCSAISGRLSVRLDRGRHEHREEVRARRAGTATRGPSGWRSSTRRATTRSSAFALGYLAHLAADSVAHNYFVPKQLAITSSTSGVGHSYWESRFETHLGTGAPARARADSARPLALRRSARPHPEPDDLQHADQPADLSRHGHRRRQRVVAAHLSAR